MCDYLAKVRMQMKMEQAAREAREYYNSEYPAESTFMTGVKVLEGMSTAVAVDSMLANVNASWHLPSGIPR